MTSSKFHTSTNREDIFENRDFGVLKQGKLDGRSGRLLTCTQKPVIPMHGGREPDRWGVEIQARAVRTSAKRKGAPLLH
jgi:hypothetical protein